MTTLWLIVGCGVLAIVYGIWATQSVMSADPGSKRMQEISEAVREGAQAYLKRQYTTISPRRRGGLRDHRFHARVAGGSRLRGRRYPVRVRPASSA